MKKLMNNNKHEAAQVIPLVVLAMLGIVGMVALILDGGSIMSNRRSAQAAADAGALAGAKQLCSPDTAPNAITIAQDYALINNGASTAVASPIQVTIKGHTVNGVNVKTSVVTQSFFAGVFGVPSLTARAEASAGCYHPSITTHLLPIAFYYNSPPLKADETDCSDITKPCEIVNYDFSELLTKLSSADPTDPAQQPLDDIYIISNDTKVCEKNVSGAIVCSGMASNSSGGNRTWIDLSEMADVSNLKKLIEDGVTKPLSLPSWLNGQPGVEADIYNPTTFSDLPLIENIDLPYHLVLVPVFDYFCTSGDPEHNGACVWHSGDKVEYIVNPNQPSYRLVGLAPFVITCVTKSQNFASGQCNMSNCNANGNPKPQCPGYLASHPTNASQVADKDAIEGYFVDGSPLDDFTGGTEGVSAGLDVISLTK